MSIFKHDCLRCAFPFFLFKKKICKKVESEMQKWMDTMSFVWGGGQHNSLNIKYCCASVSFAWCYRTSLCTCGSSHWTRSGRWGQFISVEAPAGVQAVWLELLTVPCCFSWWQVARAKALPETQTKKLIYDLRKHKDAPIAEFWVSLK